MNDRLEIASRIVSQYFTDSRALGYEKEAAEWALKCADALIKLEQETRPKEEALWMTEPPEINQKCWVLGHSEGEYFKYTWGKALTDKEWLKNEKVFESEAKIRRFLKLD